MFRTLSMMLITATFIAASPFYDDFEDDDISDWEARAQPASWWASDGRAHGSVSSDAAALVPMESAVSEDCVIEASATAIHVVGLTSRLDVTDTGIVAYVSPDNNVARIRRLSGGSTGTIYASLSAPFPNGVWYDLTLTCEGPVLTFDIVSPSTSEQWTLQAVDPSPQEGVAGLYMGDESSAQWEWFSSVSSGQSLCVDWLTVDDDVTGESSGNGNLAFESGEEIELTVKCRNDGSEILTGVSAVLQSLEPDLVLTDSFEEYPDIPVGGSAFCLDDFGVSTLAGTPDGTVWPMKLTVFADGGFDSEILFDLPLGCGMSDDLEELPTSWTFSPIESGWLNNWHRSAERNHSQGGGYSLKCGSQGTGDYSDDLYCMAISEPFNAPLSSRLEYWQWIDAELSGVPGYALDGGLVQAGQFDTWFTLGYYPYYIPVGTTGPFEAYDQVVSGTSGWSSRSVNIPSSLCGPLQLRFVFGSDVSGNREGWHVDDILVQPPLGVGEGESGQPVSASLSCSPNPSAGSVAFDVSSPMAGGNVEIFDLSGRLVAALPFMTSAGQARIVWSWTGEDGRSPASGIYFARIQGLPVEAVRLVRLAV